MNKVVIGIGLIYTLVVLATFPRWTVDDAYITFRYARNWAQSGELTWNVGQDPVEGYTGILLPLLLGMAMKAGLPPITISQAIGVISFLIGAGLLRLLVRDARIMTLYLTMPLLFTHALGGLETVLFSTLLLASVYLFVTGRQSALCLALLVTSLTRPEGALLAAIIGAVMARRGGWAWVGRFALLYVLPALVYFVWRWNYYGLLLPNTFYVKGNQGVNLKSIVTLAQFAISYLVLPSASALISGLKWQQVRDNLIWIVVLAFTGTVFTFYLFSNLEMNYSHRFFVPFYPLLLAFIAWLIKERQHAYIAIPLVGQLVVHVGLLGGEVDFARRYRQLIADEHIPAAEFVRSIVPSNEWLAVVNDAGAMPYYSGLPTLDFGKLNDEALAHGADPIERFYDIQPSAVVITSHDYSRLATSDVGMSITSDGRFSDYVLAQKLCSTAHDHYYLFVYTLRSAREAIP